MKKLSSIIVFLLLVNLTFAQRTETSINFDDNKSHILIEIENDILFQSDQYYTAGMALSFTYKNLQKTPAQLILRSKDPESFTFSGFGIEHRMFTPFSIVNPYAIENDRPYSAYLLATNYSVLMRPNKNSKMSIEMGIGIIGPAAGGEAIQSYVHELIDSDQPIGWENQIDNAFLIDIQYRIEKGFFTPWLAKHIIPIGMIRVGSLKDEIDLGLMIKFGNKSKSIAEAKYLNQYKNKFIWEFLIEARFQAVFYDATLQGGLMNGDEIVSLNTQNTFLHQYHVRTGINLYYKSFYFRYMIQWNSRDFSAGIAHRYGGASIGFSF